MSQAFRISFHAMQRIKSRRFTVEELLAALEVRQVRHKNGLTMFIDPSSRVTLFIDLTTNMVVTALRLKRDKYQAYVNGRQRKGT